MNKRKGMGLLLFVAVSAIAAVVGMCLINKRKAKESGVTDSTIANDSDNQSLDVLFDAMLESGSDDNLEPKNRENKDTVLRLEDRSWWSKSSSLVISYSLILIVAVLVFVLSMLTHSAYNSRKQIEQDRADSVRMEKVNYLQLYLDNEEAQMSSLGAKIDSVDKHIRDLKTVTKTTPKIQKKQSK